MATRKPTIETTAVQFPNGQLVFVPCGQDALVPRPDPEMLRAAKASYELAGLAITQPLPFAVALLITAPAVYWLKHLAEEQDRKEHRRGKARRRRRWQKLEKTVKADKRRRR